MPRVKEVEDSVREGNPSLPGGSPAFCLRPRRNFRRRNSRLQRLASTEG
jgi:hypothetical protein